MEDGWRQLWEGIESKIVQDVTPRKKFMGIIKKMASIVKGNKILYGFLFTAPNHIQDESKQSWKTYQERLYSILKSIIEEGIKQNEFIDLNPGMLMKAIGGLFHGLLLENEDDLRNEDFEIMLKNFSIEAGMLTVLLAAKVPVNFKDILRAVDIAALGITNVTSAEATSIS